MLQHEPCWVLVDLWFMGPTYIKDSKSDKLTWYLQEKNDFKVWFFVFGDALVGALVKFGEPLLCLVYRTSMLDFLAYM